MSLLRTSLSRDIHNLANNFHHLANARAISRGTRSAVCRTSLKSTWRPYSTGFAQTANSKSSRLIPALAAIGLVSGAYGLGVLFPPNLYTLIFPREAPPAAAAGSPEALKQARRLESEMWSIPLVRELAAVSYPLNSDTVPKAFLGPSDIAALNSAVNVGDGEKAGLTHYMVRPYVNVPETLRRHSLTAGALYGPGKLAIPPLLFVQVDEKAITGVIHLGRSICGHDGIIHGGAIATIFDEGLFRTAVANFPARIGVTAWIKMDYKAPTRADQFVVFKTKVDKVEGRKVFVSGQMEDLEGAVLVKAEALFVQPKYAHLLKNEERDKHFLGRPAAITHTLEPVSETADMK